MEINKLLVEMMLVKSKLNVDRYMEQAANTFTYGFDNARQKHIVDSIKDKLYISFRDTIFKFAEENENCIINFFIFHPNMWNEDAANCFIYAETFVRLEPVDIDSRVKIYDGVYPSGIGTHKIQENQNLSFEYTPYKPSKTIETISSEISSKLSIYNNRDGNKS